MGTKGDIEYTNTLLLVDDEKSGLGASKRLLRK